ncbi:hypothetical protein Cgig2_033533 [Carnegiea gigantea]|uniref:STAS domain-containing protein n=1 Tax=Carnegiea gigantea TaxID=171969 RepID=A0A9Q1K1N7_9CARY|nr:hypothetical protein Cgig2_033533 [Carnegiea gigantea]
MVMWWALVLVFTVDDSDEDGAEKDEVRREVSEFDGEKEREKREGQGKSITRSSKLLDELHEGIAIGRIFATFKSYHIDGNKELIAYGMMNIIGSCTYCYLTTARPRTYILGNVPNSVCYRNLDQYPDAQTIPGILILRIAAPIYFTNASYLRERILRQIDEEEDKLKLSEETNLQYVILNMDGK